MKAKTRIIRIDGGALAPEHSRLIIEVLRSDGVLAYPTETFYGLGVLAFSRKAVEKIYALKRRDRGKPISIIVADMAMAEKVADSIPSAAKKLAKEFWPGPLTVVLKAKPVFPADVPGPGGSIAMRVPGVAWLRSLVRRLGSPLTATSANVSGAGEISDPREIIRLFRDKVDLIIDGGLTPGGLPSTIVDLTSGRLRVLRAGAVPESALRDFV